jgi:hypothetical protein
MNDFVDADEAVVTQDGTLMLHTNVLRDDVIIARELAAAFSGNTWLSVSKGPLLERRNDAEEDEEDLENRGDGLAVPR